MTSPPAKPPSPGRAFAVYTGLRLALLVLSYVVLRAIGVEGLLALGGAVLLSALLSLVVLRRQREALSEALAARGAERRAEQEARRTRLDEG